MPEHPILQVDALSLSSKSRVLFTDITFNLFAGEVLAIMGPSGIGKSMLSKAIAGFLPEELSMSGMIALNGHFVSERPLLQRTAAERPAIIFQDALQALNPLASIGQQLCLALTGSKTRFNCQELSLVSALLVKLGFDYPERILAQYPSQLSGGQRQRICIGLALLGRANLIIADEPTSALDPITEAEILKLYRSNVKQQGISGILITHDLSAAMACDKLLVIDDGTMVAYGSPEQAIKSSCHPFCRQLAQLMPQVANGV